MSGVIGNWHSDYNRQFRYTAKKDAVKEAPKKAEIRGFENKSQYTPESSENLFEKPNYGLEYYAGNVHYNTEKKDDENNFNREAFMANLNWLKDA